MRIPASLFCDVFKTYMPPEISAREEMKDSFSRKFQRLLFYSICQKDHAYEERKLNESIVELLNSVGIRMDGQVSVKSYTADGALKFFDENIGRNVFHAFLECKIAIGKGDPRLEGMAYVKHAGDKIVAEVIYDE